jgi:hypothetical protein
MAKAPRKPPPKDEDEAQSQRFIETAKALEADGDLNLTEAEEAFERAITRIVPSKVAAKDRD